MATRFVKNRRGIDDLVHNAEVEAARQIAAQAIVGAAGAGRRFGGVVASYEVLRVTEDTVAAGTNHPIGHIIEWGSRNNPPYAPLRKAVSSLGLRFEEE